MSDSEQLHFVTMLGGLRQASYNGAIARTLPSPAPEGVTITALNGLSEFPLYNADLQTERLPQVVVTMADAIRAADGVIVITPEYNYSIPGALKNALDWLSRLSPPPFAGKPVAIQTASPGVIGGARAQYHLRQIFVFLDALVLNKPEVMVGQVAAKVDAETLTVTDTTTRDFVAGQLTAFVSFVRGWKLAGQKGK